MKIKTLKNGLRVLLDKSDNTLEIGVIVLGGESTESRRTLQYFHFLEHLLTYLTSDRWPDGRKNIKRLSRKNIKCNSISKGYQTQVSLKGNATEDMLDMLISTIVNFKVDESIFNKEKDEIQSEMNLKVKDKPTQFYDTLSKIVNPKHISSVSSHSNFKAVKAVNPDDITEFVKRIVVPSRTIFYMKGSIPKYSVFKKYQSMLETLPDIKPAFSISSLEKWTPPDSAPIPGIFRIDSNSSVIRLHLRWKLDISKFDTQRVVTADIVGYCLHRVLTDRLRDDLGLVYEVVVKLYFDPINTNLSYLYIETDVLSRERAKAVTLEIVRIIDDYENVITQETIQKFTENSTHAGVFDINVSRLLWNKDMITENDLSDFISNVTLKDAIKFANEHLNTDKVYLMYNCQDDLFREV